MTKPYSLRAATCVAALMIAPAAHADVTAQQVWTAWQTSMAQYAGAAAISTGAVAEDGDTVTVTDLVLSSDNDGETVRVSVPQIVFAGAGDGTVVVTSSDITTIAVGTATGGTIDMSFVQSGATLTASGTPEDVTYDIAADQYALSIDRITSPEGDVAGDMGLKFNGVTGTTRTLTADAVKTAYDIAAAGVDLLVDVSTPDDSTLMVSGKIDGIVATGSSSAPAGLDFRDPAVMFGGDYAATGSYTSGPAAYIIEASGGTGISGTSTTGPTNLTFGVGGDGLSYAVSVTDVMADLTGSEMPFPFRLSAASYDLALKTPVGPTAAPVPFRLLMGLSDVAVNDEIWAMFDPTAALPRDPATIRLEVSGAAQLDRSIMDPAQAEALAMQPGFPGKIESLTLNDLTVDAVGLTVKGSGDFTFDNADTTTFPGMPNPTGSVTIGVAGANALIDKLIAMGLIPAEQAMMPRMMLGMFAKTTGDDAVQSVIEVKDGQVLANGQRIR